MTENIKKPSILKRKEIFERGILILEQIGYKDANEEELLTNPLYAAIFDSFLRDYQMTYKNKDVDTIREEINDNMDTYANILMEMVFPSDKGTIGV